MEPTTLEMLMMRPKRCFIIGRMAARLTRKTAFRLVSSTASQSSSFMRMARVSRVMPGDGVDQRFDGGAVVHIQPRPPAAGIGRQYLADVLGALVRGGRADHLVAAPRQFQRNRRTNAARCARDQRH